ncbi:alpha-amylase family glycosyl hydrolase [Paenirhodobacter enshiensis]|uniref:Alpha-amylase n=1 Tax=Paenirhodobacter enshiensis TaxID=1105367 RepID=A0A086XV86_9RHOB|nr:alpha-amylase family glycosyl hydrolase [Paenirhodobacter enshiensis]KFI25936.1 alpha-amylase [Paenirhodobacter enshiensis]
MPSTPALLSHRLSALLAQIYPSLDAEALSERVIAAFWPSGSGFRQRPRHPSNNLWSERAALVISYGDSIVAEGRRPLEVLHGFLKRNLHGTVSGVHLLPFFPYSSDDGFAVTDYRAVNPALGDWSDIRAIGEDFGLMSDMVLNHVSAEGTWFQAYLRGEAPYDRFFMEADPADDLSAVVRPRTTPLLRAVETAKGERHVWCTFSPDQVDLDFHDPEVLLEILRVLRLHIDHGVRIIRLDAVAFLWKEPGSPSIHLPQTHAVVKLIRVLADFAAEPVIVLTETNVPKAENLSYFGRRDEAHMVYNFPLPPLVLHAMLAGTVTFLRKWLRSMPPAPLGCSYFNFTASHDGIGMRPAEGLLPPEETARLIEAIRAAGGLVSMRALPGGGEAPYELNCAYFDAMGCSFAGETAMKIARFLCSQTIVMSIEGVPAFYIHSFLATPNDREGVVRRGMNRAINRHRWDEAALAARLADPGSDQSVVLTALQRRLRLRARQPAFHPNATQLTLQLDDRVLGVWRQSLDRNQSVFALHNVSDERVEMDAYLLNLIADEVWRDLISGEAVDPDGTIVLAPYQCRWITNV